MSDLKWRVQYATRQTPLYGEDSSLLHFASSKWGMFEIFDDGQSYLLHAPRGLKLPAELFPSLDEAKARAEALEASP
jgi:hypothetical protein